MKAILSGLKGKIIHKDIPLHAYFILPREEKLAAS